MPGLVDLLMTRVHFQSSSMAKIPFLIEVSQKTTADMPNPKLTYVLEYKGRAATF